MQDGENAGPEQRWKVSLRVRHDSEGPGAGNFNRQNKYVASMENCMPAEFSAEEQQHPEIVMTPPVAVPLPEQCCYYMFNDFNHHHQHSVLVGNTHRFASTHRVCKRDGHTFGSIQSRCKNALQV